MYFRTVSVAVGTSLISQGYLARARLVQRRASCSFGPRLRTWAGPLQYSGEGRTSAALVHILLCSLITIFINTAVPFRSPVTGASFYFHTYIVSNNQPNPPSRHFQGTNASASFYARYVATIPFPVPNAGPSPSCTVPSLAGTGIVRTCISILTPRTSLLCNLAAGNLTTGSRASGSAVRERACR
jgi:hypothetical protein